MCIMWKWNNILRPLSQISKTLINAHNNYYTHTNVTVLILCMYIAYNMYRACSKFYLVCYAALAYKAKLLYIHRLWAQPLSTLRKDKGGEYVHCIQHVVHVHVCALTATGPRPLALP